MRAAVTVGRKRRKTRRRNAPASSGAVVDLFCGAGGLSHGFHLEGFEVVAGIDTEETCRHAFEYNNKGPFIRRDVARMNAAQIDALFVPGKRRILVGCAPCQPFSTYNQRNVDPKWQLVTRFGRLVRAVLPDVVSMENVPSLVNFKGGRVFDGFVDDLESANYHVVWGVLFAPDFGLAQTRSRLVLMASRLGQIDLPTPTHVDKHRTVREEIGHLPKLSHGEVHDSDPLHRASRLSALNLKRIAEAKPGGTWKDWSRRLVADCHKENTGRGYSSVYGRMTWSKPAPTITTQFYGFGNGRFGHPTQDRGLSLREGALLQGFPPDYEFMAPGERIQFAQLGRMIGNAVPVTLARAIAATVRAHIEEVS